MPAVIAVVAALVLGGIGIVIGLLANDDSQPVDDCTRHTRSADEASAG